LEASDGEAPFPAEILSSREVEDMAAVDDVFTKGKSMAVTR